MDAEKWSSHFKMILFKILSLDFEALNDEAPFSGGLNAFIHSFQCLKAPHLPASMLGCKGGHRILVTDKQTGNKRGTVKQRQL